MFEYEVFYLDCFINIQIEFVFAINGAFSFSVVLFLLFVNIE